MTKENNNNINLQATLKSQDTEEWLDIHFTRPLGFLWAKFFNSFGIHPNVVTVLSIILGVAAGVMFYYPDMTHTVIGILLLVWANLYDSADGQLARMTGKKTRLGRVLDGFAGDAWFISIYFFICLRLMPEWGWWIFLFAAISGFKFHADQCKLADYYRNIHLLIIKGKAGSELDRYAALKQEFASLKWGKDLVWKTFLFFYCNYTRSQESMTPAFQKLSAACTAKYGGLANMPYDLRMEFRAKSKPLMAYANILTFNTRAIALYVFLLIGHPWLYFVFECTVMNILLWYMRKNHEKLCREITAQVEAYQQTA